MKRYLHVIFLFVPIFSFGQVVQSYSLDQAVSESELVVEGRVLSSQTYMTVEGEIKTEYEFEIYKILKGDPDNARIQFSSFGGVHGDYAMTVCPSFHPQFGQYGVLMLREGQGASISGSELIPTSVSHSWVDFDLEYDQVTYMNRVLGRLNDFNETIYQLTGRQAEIFRTTPKPTDQPEMITINTILPATTQAGRGQEITISGSGFGSSQGIGLVFFRNADGNSSTINIPGVTYTSWTDTEIRVIVPARAGSGSITVQSSSGVLSGLSTPTLTITYNVSNVADTEPRLIDDESDGNGGYVFVYSTNTANNGVDFTSIPAAVAAVERAVTTWTNGTSFSIYGEEECGTTTAQTATSDGVNLISFDNDAYDIDVIYGSSILGVMRSYYFKCGSGEWEKTEMDMVLRRDGNPNGFGGSVDWEYGPASPSGSEIDFETVVLHELGHGHGLGHTRVSAAVMFPSVTIGATKRALQSSESTGGGYIHAESKSYNPPTGGGCPAARQYDNHDPSQMCSLLLPLDLLDFTAKVVEDLVQLEWTTLNEVDHSHIILQFEEGGRWKNLAKFNAKGNNQDGTNAYSFDHDNLWPGFYTYRLKIVSTSGEVEYSEVRSAQVDFVSDRFNWSVKDGSLSIEFHAGESLNEVQLVNVEGRVMRRAQWNKGVGTVQGEFDLSSTPHGIYFLRLIVDGKQELLEKWIYLGQ